MIEPFHLPFMQSALLEIVLLAPIAGVLGAQIVLKRMAFFTHALGTSTFPGLVLAVPTGVPAPALALASGGVFAGLVGASRRGRLALDAATGLALVAALALGVILASDVFESGSGVDRLLFGSLLAIGSDEIALTVVALAVAGAAMATSRRAWIATGFDPSAAGLGLRDRRADLLLIVAVTVAVIAALDAVGALLVSAILVMPAAAVAPFATRVSRLEVGAAALALVEGAAGLWLAYELDVPPGATIAVLGGVVFCCAVALSALRGSGRDLR